ncbi:MAG: glycoside hydrolase family 5 protein [Lachnospiraceae bacterium]|nr:glycoside hydrolase family 5 protein [Lachnospiraceae bacterium]
MKVSKKGLFCGLGILVLAVVMILVLRLTSGTKETKGTKEEKKTTEATETAETKETEGDVLAEITDGIGKAKEAVAVKNGDYPEFIAEDDLAVPDEVKNRNSMKGVAVQVNVTVSSYTGSGSPSVRLCAMARDWSGWADGDSMAAVEVGKSYDLSMDLSSYEDEVGSTLGVVRLRFDGEDGDKFGYTINSARITGPKDSEAKASVEVKFPVELQAGNGSTGTAAGGTIKKNPYGDDYNCDTHFTIPRAFTEGLGGYQDLKLHVTGSVTEYTADGAPQVYIYGMDSKYQNWNDVRQDLTEKPQSFDLTLDMAPYVAEGTLGEIGLKVTGCKDGTEVAWNIESAVLEGSGGQETVEKVDVQLKYTLTGEKKTVSKKDTEVGKHGKLKMAKVSGYTAPVIVDREGKPFQMRGVSTHGLSWFPQYVNQEAFQTFRDEWGVNMVRIAVYCREGDNAYIQKWADKLRKENGSSVTGDSAAYNDALIEEGVKAATELGMYAVIDWHVLNYNPNEDLKEAKAFFTKYAKKYKDYDNVLFEICNEPTGTEWKDDSGKDLYTYCTKLVKTIRDCGNDAIVICGTPSYSANVDDVIGHTLRDKNTIYTCHFYSASHYDAPQKRMTDALEAGVPVMVSEFGICTASGDGKYDVENADKWLDICDKNNVSYACWAISNSSESAAYFKTSVGKPDGAWTEDMLTNTSKYIINRYRDRQENTDGKE